MSTAIRERIEHAVERSASTAEQRDGALCVLRRESFPLHPESRCRVGLLASLAYEAAGGTDPEVALDGAAAMELYMAAGYVLDHVMDDEVPSDSTVGMEAALGTTLLLIAEATLDEVAARELAPEPAARVVGKAKMLLLGSCAGQMRELQLVEPGRLAAMTVDDALALTEQKAGSLGQMAGVIGAGLAGVEEGLQSLLNDCYFHYATYHQIIDDLSDAPAIEGVDKTSDFAALRPTLPVVYYLRSQIGAAACSEGELGAGLVGGEAAQRRTINQIRAAEPPGPKQLRESGATLFTQLAAEVVRNRALELAEQIQRSSSTAERLVSLLRLETGEGLEPERMAAPATTALAASQDAR